MVDGLGESFNAAPYVGKIRRADSASRGPSNRQDTSGEAGAAGRSIAHQSKACSGLSPKTVRHIRGVLGTASGRALKWGLVARNVAALTDTPKLIRSEIRSFTSDEAKLFINAVKDERLQALYLLTITLGLRRGDVLGIKWENLDFHNLTLHVKAALQRINGKLELSETKTDRSRRPLPLLDFVVKSLRHHRVRQHEERLIAGSGWRDSGFVFTTRIGTPVDPANLLDDFKRILEKAELPNIRFHDLRHSATSLLLALNIHPRVVMELLGHVHISLTMEIYSHVVPGLLRDAVDKLGVALNGIWTATWWLSNSFHQDS
jgi:integrase